VQVTALLGSKGIGRLFWLKVFERVSIESVFVEWRKTSSQ
jgi:hypothetical protein